MRLTVFITKDKIVFHISILSLACSGNVHMSVRLSYRQISTCRPRHIVYVMVVVFVCPYICTYVRIYIRTYGISTLIIYFLVSMGSSSFPLTLIQVGAIRNHLCLI